MCRPTDFRVLTAEPEVLSENFFGCKKKKNAWKLPCLSADHSSSSFTLMKWWCRFNPCLRPFQRALWQQLQHVGDRCKWEVSELTRWEIMLYSGLSSVSHSVPQRSQAEEEAPPHVEARVCSSILRILDHTRRPVCALHSLPKERSPTQTLLHLYFLSHFIPNNSGYFE